MIPESKAGAAAASPVRARLIAAAHDLFARQGYHATSVRAITRKARANLGAVTYHFGSKEALYHACIESFAQPLADTIEAAARGPGNALDRVEAMVRGVLAKFAGRPGAPAILVRELASDRPLPAPIVRIMRQNLGNLVATIETGQREGSIRPGDPVLLAFSTMAQVFFVAIAGRILSDVAGVDRRDPAQWARLAEHVTASVRRTLALRVESTA